MSVKLDNGAVCTCDGQGGCAYHGFGDAGTYRKSFEHASANYNAEKQRASDAEAKLQAETERARCYQVEFDTLIGQNRKLWDEICALRASVKVLAQLLTDANAERTLR